MTGTEAKAAIKATGHTARSLSLKLGFDGTYVSQVLNGAIVSDPMLRSIEDYLDVPHGTIKIKQTAMRPKRNQPKSILCRCPKCRKTYKVKMHYTGNLEIPWIICKACKLENSSDWEMSAVTHGSGRRV